MGKKDTTLKIEAHLLKNGLSITVKNKTYTIIYPAYIWAPLSKETKNMLVDNIVFTSTHFLSVVLDKDTLVYNTNFPLCESFIFRNHIEDILDTERVDGVPFQSYMKKLYNATFEFTDKQTSVPPFVESPGKGIHTLKSPVIVPFTFGKESLFVALMAKKMGMNPILVYFEDPMERYETEYKLKRLSAMGKMLDCPVHFVKNDVGLFRGGLAFGKHSDVGWGVQTTLYTIMCLPFVYYYNAHHVLYGNEYANNEYEYAQGWKLNHSYDQTIFWMKQQSVLVNVLSSGRCSVQSMLEPLDEPNIFYLLHSLYPEFGRHQFSCRAEKPLLKGSQWCHKCYKCARMYLFASAFGVDPSAIGFKKNLLIKEMFKDYLFSSLESGDPKDLDFAFYTLLQKKVQNEVVDLFKKKRLPHLKSWSWYVDYYTSLRTMHNVPSVHASKLMSVYRKGLKEFRSYLLNI
ncbi:MAG TPA: hypothetical protein DCS29_02140 [Candidatus Magasanikbacteria bacterium]|nr:MAG: hypothetical protein A2479_00460 [Candidatus Magasanikbacteria bacterium RIFOXYC2_FULL_39_8]HAT03556.1 hypothetical protein [Candidatus Magasanikbacteria bacterium]